MRLTTNHEARAAWARRHGLDPERIVDGDYMGRRTTDGRREYEFRQIIEGADGNFTGPRGEALTVVRRVVVPADDPLPPRFIV